MAHTQKPVFVFRRNGRVPLNRQGRQFSRLLATEVCASAIVMLDTPCSELVWRVLATHSIRQFLLHYPPRASPCAITFQLDSTSEWLSKLAPLVHHAGIWGSGVIAPRMLEFGTIWTFVVISKHGSLWSRGEILITARTEGRVASRAGAKILEQRVNLLSLPRIELLINMDCWLQ
jgi:hypothetical protein